MPNSPSTDHLFIRVGRSPDEPVYWFDSHARTPEDIHQLASSEALGELSTHPAAQRVCLLFPASMVVFRSLTLPAKTPRALDALIAHLTEESIASDPDTLHWATLCRQETQLQVMGMDERVLRQTLESLNSAGLGVVCATADALLLPLAEAGWSACRFGDEWLIRQSAYAACVVDDRWCARFLAMSQPECVTCHSDNPPDYPALHRAPSAHPFLLMLQALPDVLPTLLQGKFTPRKPTKTWGRVLPRITVSLLAAAVGLAMLLPAVTLWQLTRLENQVTTQIETVYRHWFPESPQTRNLRFYFEQNMKKRTPPFLPALTRLNAAKKTGITFIGLDYDQTSGAFTLQLEVQDNRALDAFMAATDSEFHFSKSNAQGQSVTLSSRRSS
ncbi:type II secretion system protein GspL [Nissabacter sp. SGAir0207]|uniref:type II secretion system protein GspL n=1 Tax=Nissabacter sp. SGAir0207 TaxID=2126321 RepID=UPI0010CD10D5|nr:type II secretion system protein GspL [Nissabacter sp. SGAir0207]QCR34814.1 hypothetical protein C1N62_01275 [Nissabacter sp. SGAir0207]